jgi:hypothetical protein
VQVGGVQDGVEPLRLGVETPASAGLGEQRSQLVEGSWAATVGVGAAARSILASGRSKPPRWPTTAARIAG